MSNVFPLVQAPAEAPPLPNVELVETDGEPLESTWHRDAMNLLIEQVRYHLRDRRDYFVGGNMFIYFSLEQARNRDFRGPDFLYVSGVRWEPARPYWVVWEEGGRYPDVIIELLSTRTAQLDRTTKKDVYEKTFRTPEYFLYDPYTEQLQGWRLVGNTYQAIVPNDRGWLWSEQLQLWLGTYRGLYQGYEGTWLRFFDAQGQVVPLFSESAEARLEAEKQRAEVEKQRAEAEKQRAEAEKQRAEVEKQCAEAEKQRAEAAEAELARLRALLGGSGEGTDPA